MKNFPAGILKLKFSTIYISIMIEFTFQNISEACYNVLAARVCIISVISITKFG